MNALDALLDFAALMHTSPAMSLAPGPQSTAPADPGPARHNDAVQQAAPLLEVVYDESVLDLPQPRQREYERVAEPWLLEMDPPLLTGLPVYQPVWTAEAERCMQQQQQQLQQQQQQQEQHQYQRVLPASESTPPCGHHPVHQCPCTSTMSGEAMGAPYVAAAPWVVAPWAAVSSPSLQQAGAVTQYVRGEGVECGYGYGCGCSFLGREEWGYSGGFAEQGSAVWECGREDRR